MSVYLRSTYLKAITIALIALSCTACSSKFPLRSQIEGIGPIQLSQSNSNILANQFLADEANASPALWRFLKSKGSPDAVELNKKFLSSYRGHIYYLSDGDAYLFEDDGDDWEIIGPGKIPNSIARELHGIKNFQGQAPLALGPNP